MFNIKNLIKFSENIAIRSYESIDSVQTYRYKEIIDESVLIQHCLEKLFSKNFDDLFWKIPNIAVQLPCHSPLLLPAIISIINSNASVCFLDSNIISSKISSQLQTFKTNIVLVDQHNFEKHNFLKWSKFRQKIDLMIFSKQCVLLELDLCELLVKEIPAEFNEIESSKQFYCTTTSGTASDSPKVIGVTYKCFIPNVLTLSKIYQITQNDIIFVSAPPTFDPFMLDICVALQNGASLLMTTNPIRLSPKLLLRFLFHPENGVTIMQTTPSLFTRWSNEEIIETIFTTKSSLRLLALGGEPFPTMEKVKLWQNWDSSRRKRIFNLYGLTEISCWSSIYEVTKEDVALIREIRLGQPLDDLIKFQVKSIESGEETSKGIGELYIESKIRKCFLEDTDDGDVLNNNTVFALKTGDLVEIDEMGNLFYRCRCDSIVKRYGRKVNLNDIEQLVRPNSNIIDACCVFDVSRNTILLFVIINRQMNKNWSEIEKALRKSFSVKDTDRPDTIVPVKEFPLSSHGKVSKRTLLANFERNIEFKSSKGSILDYFTKAVNKSLDFKYIFSTNNFKTAPKTRLQKRQKSLWESSFASLGGDSLKALQLTKELETKYRCSLPNLLALLLNENISIRDVFLYVTENAIGFGSAINTKTNSLQTKDIFRIKWSIDLKKCIDAAPTICFLDDFQSILSVGSHSGIIKNVLPENGEIVSKLVLPDRIESQVTQYKHCGIVGCYDGLLYCFDIRSGKINWKFDSGGMIKCRPLCVEARVIFGNYSSDNNLWCLNAEDGVLVWSKRIGTRSIYSNPIQLDDDHIIVCTLDGTIANVNSTTGEEIWKVVFNSPIFSTSAVFQALEERYIIFATVDGTINCLSGSGAKIWSQKVDGNIFTSFELVEQYVSQSTIFINFLFGSHNCFLYFLHFDLSEKTISERWKFKMSSKLTSTPKVIEINGEKFVVSCLTNGLINLNRVEDGFLRCQIQLPGEVFSTPAIFSDKIFVGCRNNLLYCLEIK